MKKLILLLVTLASAPVLAASHTIMLTGYWSPSNDMLRRFSPHPEQNPEGWVGANWQGSGYDVYAFFPEYPPGSPSSGVGDFRVDYAATFNDFMKYTAELSPVAIVSFGRGAGPWEIEGLAKPSHVEMFRSDHIPSNVGEEVRYPIPDELKVGLTYVSSLPLERIRERVNNLNLPEVRAWIDQEQGAGYIQCAFMSTLLGWYHAQHSDPSDPAHNRMAGFIHMSTGAENGADAVTATLHAVIEGLREPAAELHPQF